MPSPSDPLFSCLSDSYSAPYVRSFSHFSFFTLHELHIFGPNGDQGPRGSKSGACVRSAAGVRLPRASAVDSFFSPLARTLRDFQQAHHLCVKKTGARSAGKVAVY